MMRRRWSVARATQVLVVLAIASSAWRPHEVLASWFESMVMPGEVVAKHARVERECNKCHEPFDKAAQGRLCLACHHDVAADLDERHGYHGHDPAVQDGRCTACHTEHKGRAATIVPLDREHFDHHLTDYPLRGGHARVACDDCHAPDKRYREAGPHCANCHARKDPHDGSLGAACDRCHEESAWKTVRFDHNATAFPLQGRHRDARCEKCHATKRYKPTPTTCAACHTRDDRHHGGLGAACQSCHTPQGWSKTTFDHTRQTHFPLLGRHARTPCDGCHKVGVRAEDTPTNCFACHQKDDAHHEQFGRTCDTCHTPTTEWRRHTFDHARQTRFPLRGRHAETHCTDCHRSNPRDERLSTSCFACHRNDDVHRGREGTRCESCHDERGWHREVLFDHSSTHFPLDGGHARVACNGCHFSPVFKNVGRECVSCHQDIHKGKEGPRCERCHDTSTFRVVRTPNDDH